MGCLAAPRGSSRVAAATEAHAPERHTILT